MRLNRITAQFRPNARKLLLIDLAAALLILLRTVYRLAVECQGESGGTGSDGDGDDLSFPHPLLTIRLLWLGQLVPGPLHVPRVLACHSRRGNLLRRAPCALLPLGRGARVRHGTFGGWGRDQGSLLALMGVHLFVSFDWVVWVMDVFGVVARGFHVLDDAVAG